jgi:hypothetical protein
MRLILTLCAFSLILSNPTQAETLYSSEGGFEPADWNLTAAEIVEGKIVVPADQAVSAKAELLGSENWGPCLITMRVEIERSATIHIFALRDYFFMTNPQAYGDPTAQDWPKIFLRQGEEEGGGVSVLSSDGMLTVPPSIWTFQWGIVESDLVVRIWPDGQQPGPFATLGISGPQHQAGPLWLVLHGNDGDLIVHDLTVEGVGAVASDPVTSRVRADPGPGEVGFGGRGVVKSWQGTGQ